MYTLILGLASPALACGGMFGPPESMALSHTQEAIFTRDGGEVQVDYRILFNGDTADFGWVIPIRGEWISLEETPDDTFDLLRNATRPLEDFVDTSTGGCVGAADKGGLEFDSANAVDGGRGPGVEIVGSGFTGSYEWTVLDATNTTALLDWLEANGLSVGPSGPTIDEYVGEGGWQWVALKLHTDEVDPDEAQKLPGVSIRYSGDELVFPSRMVKTSMADQVHTIVYVKGDQVARASAGWTSAVLREIYDEGESGDYLLYEAFPEALEAGGIRKEFQVVYAGELDGSWVTRFEVLADPLNHTVDAGFAIDAGTEPVQLVITNHHGGCAGGGWWLAPGLLLGLGLRRGRPLP